MTARDLELRHTGGHRPPLQFHQDTKTKELNLMKHLFASLLMVALLSMPLTAQSARGGQPAADESDRPRIDVDLYSVDVTLVPEEHRLIGKADIHFKQLDRKNFATFDLDRRLRVSSITISGADARFRQYDLDSTVEVDLSGQQFN